MKMDQQQLYAVNHLGKNTLVSASAGAGKTRVLVERLLKRCIQDRISLEHILAVTFTEAAAGEMKNRVASRLYEELENTKDKDTKAYIQEQLILLDQAWITTIDSFCLQIIKKYSNVIGLNSATSKNVLSGGQQEAFLYQSFIKAVALYDEENHQNLVNCFKYCSARSEDDTKLYELIKRIVTSARSSISIEDWFENARLQYQPIKSLKSLSPEIKTTFYKALLNHINTLSSLLEDCIDAATEKELDEGLIQTAKEHHTLLQACIPCLENEDYDLFLMKFEAFGDGLKTPTDSKDKEYSNKREYFYNYLDRILAFLYDSDTICKDQSDLTAINNTLIDLSKLTYQIYQDTKKETLCLDFTDMEHFAWEILTVNDDAISHIYQDQLQEVMVDEFQDTSILQNEIIKKLAKQGTIFRVGDIKQSIYRFRQAKPSLMRDLTKDSLEEHIVLAHNYRSKSSIVEWNNRLFQRLMNISGCEDTYTHEDEVTIGTSAQKLKEPDPIQLILLKPTEEDKNIFDGKEEKAKYIAYEIENLINQGYAYKDISILVRSHQDKHILRQVFDRFGFPYDIDAREGFYRSKLCLTILGLVRAILTPTDEVSLVSLLTSPLYEMDDETLANLKIQSGSIYQGLIDTKHPIFDDLNEFKRIADEDGIVSLLSQLVAKNEFFLNSEPKDLANFDYLFEQAINLERSGQGIYDLLNIMEASIDEKSNEAISKGKDEDTITVTTIHQSKGLQYPVVFLWSTGKNVDNDKSEFVMVNDQLYLGLKHMDKDRRVLRQSPQRIAIEYQAELEDLEEYTRLLYVALTRAEEKLYIVDIKKNATAYQPQLKYSTIAHRKGMTGLITAALEEIPGLFTIKETTPEFPHLIVRPYKDNPILPTFKKKIEIYPPLLKPSEHEFTEVPNLNFESYERNTQYGTKIHEVLASLPNTAWTKEDLKDYVLTKNDQERILAFAKSDLYQKSLAMDIHKEYPFYVETKDFRMSGTMDFVAIGKDEIILIDFKTDNLPLEEIKTRYEHQLRAYQTALEILYPKHKIITAIYSLHHSESILI